MKLTALKGIHDKREKDFFKLGIFTAEDLVRFFPRTYLDMTDRLSVTEARHNETALFACTLTGVETRRGAGGKSFVRAHLEQNGRYFTAVWFHMPYLASRLTEGEYLFYGRVQNSYGQVSLVNPTFEKIGERVRMQGLVPVYPLRGNLTQRAVRDAVREALRAAMPASAIPAPLIGKYAIPPLEEAYRAIHAPANEREMGAAAERIALEEYFSLIAAFKLIKGDRAEARVRKYPVSEREVAEFEKRFPFRFTRGQQGAVRDIYDDLTGPCRMNRLLQGDVGSGKTAVALTGIFMAVASGYQAAYLAPTEVLAAQNFALLQKIFPDRRVAFLSGASTAKEKRETKAAVARGEIDILCGTHAVLQSDVLFRDLGFCVCDEQHRFGVAQRNRLGEKGEAADVLVMSATPIPRTLSLVFYGDLDVTTIPDKPAARQETTTAIVPARKYNDMLRYLRGEVKKGRQAYYVCPRIEDEEGQTAAATECYEELCARLPDVRFALLHGKMKEREKTDVMTAFKEGKYDCLVSTTVIEVGVDVPNATVMIIADAERFGLSQLHQLRGRVGRGSEKSWCFLLVGSGGEEAAERLNVLKTTSDGFRLAEKDLAMRGGGDFLGTRQSGRALSEIKNLRYSQEVVFTAKKLVDEAFNLRIGLDGVKRAAMKKYESLKDVVLN